MVVFGYNGFTMSFRKANYPFSEHYPESERYVVPGYKFTCTNETKSDRIELYQIDRNGAKLLYEGNKDDPAFFTFLEQNVLPNLKETGYVSGGHSVIHLEDKFSCGAAPIESTKLAMKILELIQEKNGFKYDYLVQLNDLYVEKDLNRDDVNKANFYRDKMLNPFIVPRDIADIIRATADKLKRPIDFHYCTSKNSADKFKRFIKKKKEESPCFVEGKEGENSFWYYVINGEKIPVLKNNKPNCISCNAAMLRDIRYDVTDSGEFKDSHLSYIGIFPFCSKSNVLNGCRIAYFAFDNFDLKTYMIFFGGTCN